MSTRHRKGADEKLPPKRRRTLAGKAEDESDPEWKRWFQEVDRKQKVLRNLKNRTLVVATIDKDGKSVTFSRCKSDPVLIKKILGKKTKSVANPLNIDMVQIKTVWKSTVGEDICRETEVFSFKNGILTIAVSSSTLLQEIRQFHKEAIDRDLRDSWPLSIPLIRVIYRTGKH